MPSDVQRRKIVGVLLATGLILAFLVVVIISLNPFKTLPVVNIEDAYWKLGKEGYILHLSITTNEPVQLVGVDIGGVYYDVVYDVSPPSSILEIPTRNIDSKIKLHFNIGSPKDVYPKSLIPSTDLLAVYGANYVFLVGSLSEPATISAVPVSKESRILVVMAPGEEYRIRRFLDLEKMNFSGLIYGADKLTLDILKNATTILFIDVIPEPSLMNSLVRDGKAVVAVVIERGLGELRFNIGENGTVTVAKYPPDTADIDYLGAHCILYSKGVLTSSRNNAVNSLLSIYGSSEYTYVISPSTYCRDKVIEVYGETKLSEVVFGKLNTGFYFVSSQFKYVLTLAMMGFFESRSRDVFITSAIPFQGVYPLLVRATEKAYVISVITSNSIRTLFVEKALASYNTQGSIVTIEAGISDKTVVLTGMHRIRIEEYTYDGDLLKVVEDKNLTLPASLQISYNPFHFYLLYIDDVPTLIMTDESILSSSPIVAIEYSSVYELFMLKVSRYDEIRSPLVLTINGKDVFVLDQSSKSFELTNRKTGFYNVVVKDVYGRVVKSVKFQVVHIYETPLFILAMLSGIASVTSFIYVIKKRERKEVEEVRMVFYKLPDIEKRTITESDVEESITRILSTRKYSPRLESVMDDLYKKHPLLRVIDEIAVATYSLLASKKGKFYGIYSRYMPELDDTITIVGPRNRLTKDFYTQVIAELAKKFGMAIDLSEEVKDIVDVDLTISAGDKLLLVTYAPSSNIRDAIDRALTSFIKLRSISRKMERSPVGVAIVTEPNYVKVINSIIDKLLNQDYDTASKILRDMTVYTHHISPVPKDVWLSKYVLVAVPITRLAPLLAFVKTDAVRLANKYYRLVF